MKKLFCLVAILSMNYCRAQPNSGKISADIKGLGNDTVYVFYYLFSNIDAIKKDTITAKNNVFTYQLPMKEHAALAILPQKSFYKRISGGLYMPQTKFIELLISPGDNIQISGNLDRYYLHYSVTGSPINEHSSKFRETFKTPSIEAVRIELQIDSLNAIGGKKEEVAELFGKRGQQQNQISNAKVEFIDQHLNNDLAAFYLTRLSPEIFAKYYPRLTNKVRNGMFSDVLKNTYQKYLKYSAAKTAEKELTEGKPAPHFSLTGKDGKLISLAQFKGKYIVLDFWGTWCGPCMKELPDLKAVVEKYSATVNFVGIACLENEKNWKKVIDEHHLGWTQLINSDENDVSVLYGVKAYPTKIIIDKDFNIVQRFVGLTDDFYRTLDELHK
jgi:thiol-disulfide isomerase/thioredoxin